MSDDYYVKPEPIRYIQLQFIVSKVPSDLTFEELMGDWVSIPKKKEIDYLAINRMFS